jgi:hypothetical protein
MFQTQARTERFNVSKVFVESKLVEGTTVGPHVIKMVGYTQRLEKLGFLLGQELATDFILASLPPSYGNFISNYLMHGAKKGLMSYAACSRQQKVTLRRARAAAM